MIYEVDIFHVNKHESLLQIDTIIFDGVGQTYPKYPNKFAVALLHFKKKLGRELGTYLH